MAVLESDTVRQNLLQQEKSLTTKLEAGDDVSGDLTEVFERLEEIESHTAEARASVILAGLGFTSEMQDKETSTFSGGWRMRLALGQALFCKPDLLLLDEPTNMLDIQTVIWLETYLTSWPSTLLVVSHDRSFLDHVVTDILHLNEKRIHSFHGNYTEYHLAASDLENGKYREELQSFINRSFNKNKQITERLERAIKTLTNLPVLETKPVKFQFPDINKIKGPILSLSDVSFSYPGNSEPILKQVDISITMDTKVCIVGQNGAGKTTLINLLLDKILPTEGRRSVHKHLRVGHFTQHFVDQLDLAVSAVELMQRELPGLKEEEYRKMLGKFGVRGPDVLQQIETLSGGQKARVAFAVLASRDPNCLVMDEPTNHLDMDTVEAMGVALAKFQVNAESNIFCINT